MNERRDPLTIAEMFADMSDMFSDSIDHDALSTLLAYCLDVAGMSDGTVVLLGEGHHPDTIVGTRGRVDPTTYVPAPTAARALRTLNTEVSIIAESHDLVHDYAFPLRVRGAALGVVHLSGDHAPPLGENELSLLQSIADAVASTIDQTHRLHQARTLVSQLQGALDSRVVIEQAKGILAAQNRTDMSRAFNEIRSMARRDQRPGRAVATEIVSSVTALSDSPSGAPEK